MYGVLIARNPKVAGSNPAPATNGAKAQVRGPFRDIGEGLDRSPVALRVGMAADAGLGVIPAQDCHRNERWALRVGSRTGNRIVILLSSTNRPLTCGFHESMARPGHQASNQSSNHVPIRWSPQSAHCPAARQRTLLATAETMVHRSLPMKALPYTSSPARRVVTSLPHRERTVRHLSSARITRNQPATNGTTIQMRVVVPSCAYSAPVS